MFVQVIKGTTNDPAAFRAQSDRWSSDVRPGAVGFLGGTGGVTDDGTFIIAARFADEAAAKANSDRAEQGQWWDETSKYINGTPSFRESTDVSTLFDGGSDDAGFVQVMEGTVSDRAKAEALETPEMLDALRAARPDLTGALRAWFEDGTYVEFAYFTSEAAAREGETSAEFEAAQQEYTELFGEPTFTDLRSPILIPGRDDAQQA